MDTEIIKGVVCGIVFGIASPVAGHPFDTLKSKMQAQVGYTSGSSFRTLGTVVRNEGFFALWRGLTPPLLGSMVFRSLQFSTYNAVMTKFGDAGSVGRVQLPGCGGLEARVVLAGTAATTVRALFETPLEYIKVRMQTGQALSLGQVVRDPLRELPRCYTGLQLTWIRLWIALGGFFCLIDHFDRHHKDLAAIPVLGPLLKGSLCSTLAWWAAWPWEVVKNQVQAGLPIAGLPQGAGIIARLRHIVAQHGVVGLYRGIGPGTARSLAANGCAMVAFTACNSCFASAPTAATAATTTTAAATTTATATATTAALSVNRGSSKDDR